MVNDGKIVQYKELIDKIDIAQKELASYRPFGEELLPLVRDYYRVSCTYTSNAIEGFTYTETETKILLEDGLTAGGKSLKDMYAVLGHANAYNKMFELIKNNTLTEENILLFHSLLEGSLANNAIAGEYRKTPVFITGTDYVFLSASEVPGAMKEFFVALNDKKESMHPIELAAFAHKEIATIHPFADGNGRVARLAMNSILLQKEYLPAIIPPILRNEYISAIKQANYGNDEDFKYFIARLAYEELLAMNRQIRGATLEEKNQQNRIYLKNQSFDKEDIKEFGIKFDDAKKLHYTEKDNPHNNTIFALYSKLTSETEPQEKPKQSRMRI